MTRRRLVVAVVAVAALLLACGGGEGGGTADGVHARANGIVGTRTRALANGSLVAAGQDIDDALLLAILEDPRVPELRDVELFDNALSAEGVRTLLTHAKTARPRTLHLGSNPIGDEGLLALAASDRLLTVENLYVGKVGATASGMAALARSPHTASLKLVQVGFQPLGDDGATALVELRTGAMLLDEAGIGGVGARALLAGTVAPALSLDGNSVGAGGLVGLRALAPTLVSVSLERAGLGAADAAALAGVPAPALRHLSLSYAHFGDDGVRALLAAPWFAQLASLDVTGTGASAETYAALRAAWGERPGLSAG
ncbi:MAG: hypothetical protein V4850_29375 [Myxococcota bacterium]